MNSRRFEFRFKIELVLIAGEEWTSVISELGPRKWLLYFFFFFFFSFVLLKFPIPAGCVTTIHFHYERRDSSSVTILHTFSPLNQMLNWNAEMSKGMAYPSLTSDCIIRVIILFKPNVSEGNGFIVIQWRPHNNATVKEAIMRNSKISMAKGIHC